MSKILSEINIQDEHGDTLLIRAAKFGDYDDCQFLLNNGAEVNIKCPIGWVAVFWANWNRHLDIAKLLIKHKGLNTEVRDNDGRTLLMWACFCGNHEIVEALIEDGADVNAKDYFNRTALMWAAWKGHIIIVECLIEAGADANIFDYAEETALINSIQTDKSTEKLIKTILEAGDNISSSYGIFFALSNQKYGLAYRLHKSRPVVEAIEDPRRRLAFQVLVDHMRDFIT